jgi:Fe-S-cluster containining protein
MLGKNKTLWYAGGLHFECQQCGRCCSGPGEGYIWVTSLEIKLIAGFLKIEQEQLRHKFLKRVGLRTTIIEQPNTRDCVFLRVIDGQKQCAIYPVRPSQCRAWNRAAQKCSGINRGRLFSFEEIENIRKSKNGG